MQGIPIVTIEEIKKDEFLFRFAHCGSILVEWPPPERFTKDPQLIKDYYKIVGKHTGLEQMIITFGNVLKNKVLEESDKFAIRH